MYMDLVQLTSISLFDCGACRHQQRCCQQLCCRVLSGRVLFIQYLRRGYAQVTAITIGTTGQQIYTVSYGAPTDQKSAVQSHVHVMYKEQNRMTGQQFRA